MLWKQPSVGRIETEAGSPAGSPGEARSGSAHPRGSSLMEATSGIAEPHMRHHRLGGLVTRRRARLLDRRGFTDDTVSRWRIAALAAKRLDEVVPARGVAEAASELVSPHREETPKASSNGLTVCSRPMRDQGKMFGNGL